MHKKESVKTARKSTIFLKERPNQVFILRDSYYFLAKQIKTAHDARRLICPEDTESFPSYCSKLHQNPVPLQFINHMEQVEAEAIDHVDRLKAITRNLENDFSDMAKKFSSEELRIIQKREPFTLDIIAKLFKQIDSSTVDLIRGMVPNREDWPKTIFGARNTFAYRYVMCMVLLYCRWVHYGRNQTTSIERVLNDVMDMQTAGIATFFGGLLSNDQKMKGVHKEARFLLRQINAYVG